MLLKLAEAHDACTLRPTTLGVQFAAFISRSEHHWERLWLQNSMRVPWGDFRFRRGPLLHSISLDGSETVAGLRQLDRARRGEAATSALGQAWEGAEPSPSTLSSFLAIMIVATA